MAGFRLEKGNRNRDDLRVLLVGVVFTVLILLVTPAFMQLCYETTVTKYQVIKTVDPYGSCFKLHEVKFKP